MTDAAEGLPDPLVPAEVDLRGYEFMGLYGDRLFKSRTWIEASPEAKIAALRLWWQAYGHEIPAASLPDNDQLLADYAGYGVAVKGWLKIKPQAMRGWRLCNDGRWYHPFVAELALEAWEKRKAQRDRTEKARQARLLQNQLQNQKASVTDIVTRSVTESKGKERKGKEVNTSSGKPDIKTLVALGVDEQIAKDWLAVRKAKRAPLTETSLDELKIEAGKAGLSVAETISICAKRSWQGFKASWDWRRDDDAPIKQVAV